MNKNDGIAAFPLAHDVPPTEDYERAISVDRGMSLRDYFAAKAMQALIACVWERSGDSNQIIDNDGHVSLHIRAYEHADAMLAERDK